MKPPGQKASRVLGSGAELATRITAVADLFESRKLAAEAAGVSTDQLARYIRGENQPSFLILSSMALKAGVNLYWLATGTGTMRAPDGTSQTAPVPIRSADELADGFVLVPRYDVRASAGAGAVIHSEQIVDYLAFKAEWVHKALRIAPEALALIEASGDSMETTISDGDLLLVNTSVPRIKDNAIYALNIDGDLIVKRVQRHLDGSLTVKSDNDRYRPEEVPASLAASLRVIGQVIWHGRMVR